MISTLLICMVLGTLVVWFSRKLTNQHGNKDPPVYSESLPLIGVLHMGVTNSRLHWKYLKAISENTAKEGGIVITRYGPLRTYFITDIEIAAAVANQCLGKMFLYNYLECWFGQGIFTASVPTWKPFRKIVNPMFSLSAFYRYLDIFNDQAKKLVKDVDCFAGMESFDISEYIRYNVLKSIYLIVFGNNGPEDDEMFKKYLEASHEVWKLATGRFLKIWQHSDFIYELCGNKRKQDEFVRVINEFSDHYIQKRLAYSQSITVSHSDDNDDKSGVNTFLDMYLEFMNTHNWTLQNVRDMVNTTVGGAFDTTSNQLEIILVYIGSHPETQERVYEEIFREVGLEEDINKEGLQKLVYTEAVIKEILRLVPIAPMVGRVIETDLHTKNYTLRAGSSVFLMLYNMNRDSSWGPNADQFRPERWLEPGGVPRNSNSFASFSIGRRNCIGKNYAMISLKMHLVHFIRKYKVEADYRKLEFMIDGLLRPVKGNKISIKRRN